MAQRPGMLHAPELVEAIAARRRSTRCSSRSPTCQGRLVGKRVTGHYFVEHMRAATSRDHACNYLLAVDVDMTPLPGYDVRELGAGLRRLRAAPPTSSTLRTDPVAREDGARAVRPLRRGDRRAGRGVAPPDPAAPGRAGRGAGLPVKMRVRARVLPVPGLLRGGRREGLPRAHAALATSSRTTTSSRRPATSTSSARSATAWTTRASRSSSRRARPGKGQHEINLVYADAGRDGRPARRSTRTAPRRSRRSTGASLTFMAKYSMDDVGSSCHVHSSVWDADGTESLMWGDDATDHLSAGRSAVGSAASSTRGGELAWMFAPTSTRTSATSRSRGHRPRSRGVTTTARAGSGSSATDRRTGSSRASPAPT